jgi:ketosteroid isomerase-like protein
MRRLLFVSAMLLFTLPVFLPADESLQNRSGSEEDLRANPSDPAVKERANQRAAEMRASENPRAAEMAAIEQADQELTAAILAGDADGVAKSTADGFVYTDFEAYPFGKSRLVDDIKNGRLKVTRWEIDNVEVAFFGTTAVEVGRLAMKAIRSGHDVSGLFAFTRVWVRNAGGAWQTVAFQETRFP